MQYADFPKIVKGVIQTPALPRHLIVSTARAAFHPLERRLLDGWSFPPRSISIMITDRCNLRCRMCQYSYCESPEFSLNQAGFMPLELFRRILETCPGKPMIGLTGGEPLLHAQVAEFIQELKQRGFFCSLTTNGSFLRDKAAQLCESKLDLLVVSIDGDQATHDRIRSPGAFERAVSGVREILKLPGRPVVAISTVVNDINHRELENSFILAESLGVDILNFNHLWIQTDQMIEAQQDDPDLPQSGRVLWQLNHLDIDTSCVYDSIHAIQKKKRRLLVNQYPDLNREETDTYYHQPEQFVKVNSTRCAWQSMKIYPSGEVGICREYHAGNVKDQPLREIWNNPRYRQFRRYLSEKSTCPICSRCCLVFTKI